MQLSDLKKHQWKLEEAKTAPWIISLFCACYLNANQEYEENLFSVVLYTTEKNYVHELTRSDETAKAFQWVLKKHKDEPTFFRTKIAMLHNIRSTLDKTIALVRSSAFEAYDGKKLLELYNDLYALGNKQYAISIIAEAADCVHPPDHVQYLLHVGEKDRSHVIEVMTSPTEQSFFDSEKADLLDVALHLSRNAGANLQDKLAQHTRRYFWIQNSFAVSKELTVDFFEREARELAERKTTEELQHTRHVIAQKVARIKKEQEKLIARHALDDEARAFYDLIRTFAVMQDVRKECVQKQVWCVDKILEKISVQKNVPLEKLHNYLVYEIQMFLTSGTIANEENLAKRGDMTFYSTYQNNGIVTQHLYDRDHATIQQLLHSLQKSEGSKIITGYIASRGGNPVVRGKVRVILDSEGADIENGEILVAGMTRPDYVPLMKKALAIITNEGGITSHAAIISRELKIPCIIGTKIATQVLKDGMLVEVDTNRGIVKIL
ncbi:MAG: PEP-utilizing enzyme [Patescibacteria group bacterium]